MTITCPSCNLSGNLPLRAGLRGTVTCPKCRHRFQVNLPPTGTESAAPSPSRKTHAPPEKKCPHCGHVQEEAYSCLRCGLVFIKYRGPEEKPPLPIIEPPVERQSTLAQIGSSLFWLLTDRRVGSFVTTVLVLIVGYWWFSATWRQQTIQRQFLEVNEAERRKAEQGSVAATRRGVISRSMSEEESRLVAELRQVAGKAREDGEACLAECRLNLRKLEGEADPGKDVAQASSSSDLDSSCQLNLSRVSSIPRQKMVVNDAYYVSVHQLAESVVTLNSLRSDPSAVDYRAQLTELEGLFRNRLSEVELNEPRS